MKDRMLKDKMRSLGASTGTAMLAVLVVGVVAFGAGTIRPLVADRDGDAAATATPSGEVATAGFEDPEGGYKPTKGHDEPGDEATPKPKPDGDEKPKDKPKDEPKDEPKEEPKPDEPKEEPKPDEPKPEPSVLGLEAWTKGSYVKLGWTKYLGDGFEYYKLVRSKDATVTWPLGEKDTLVAAIGDPYSPWFADKPGCGHEFHYRVFAVRHGEGGYVVLSASNTVGAYVQCEEPPAEPKEIGLDAWVTEEGAVQLAWGGCAKDGFWAYKVVRSAVNESPTYPLKDGDELIAAIGDPAQTGFTDTDVAPGETWTYRVLALGEGGVVLCISPARTVTLEPAEPAG
jgi:hypothetical protein